MTSSFIHFEEPTFLYKTFQWIAYILLMVELDAIKMLFLRGLNRSGLERLSVSHLTADADPNTYFLQQKCECDFVYCLH